MKVAQNDETIPNTQSVHPPHIPSIANTQLSPSGSPVRKRETPGILSRMFAPFAGITYPYVRSPLPQRIAASCFVLHLIALLFIMFPLRYFFPVDSETAADVRVFDYTKDDPSFLQSNQASPPLITRYRLLFSICLH